MSVKLSWKGTGPISADRQRSTLIDEDTGLPFTIISRGRMRDATVTGTALLPDEISWTLSGESGNLAASHEVNISYRHLGDARVRSRDEEAVCRLEIQAADLTEKAEVLDALLSGIRVAFMHTGCARMARQNGAPGRIRTFDLALRRRAL